MFAPRWGLGIQYDVILIKIESLERSPLIISRTGYPRFINFGQKKIRFLAKIVLRIKVDQSLQCIDRLILLLVLGCNFSESHKGTRGKLRSSGQTSNLIQAHAVLAARTDTGEEAPLAGKFFLGQPFGNSHERIRHTLEVIVGVGLCNQLQMLEGFLPISSLFSDACGSEKGFGTNLNLFVTPCKGCIRSSFGKIFVKIQRLLQVPRLLFRFC